jgi:hypothetical protein
MMRLACFVLLIVAAAGAGATELWRWVDDQGVVHYSDRPFPGAEKIVISGAQTFSAPALPAGADEDDSEQADGSVYRRLAITQPGREETLWNIEGRLDVSIAVDPAIRGRHSLQVFLDGQRVEDVPPTATAFTVGNVFRGEHTLTVSIVDEAGRELVSSAPVKFFVQQTSLNNPNNPNNSPPRPTPRPARPGGG